MAKVGFVLSGEGAKGAFQAAQLMKLADEGIIPDVIIGVSSGAINAFVYSAEGPEFLLKYWENITRLSQVFKMKWLTGLFSKGLFSPKPLMDDLEKINNDEYLCDVHFPLVSAYSGQTEWIKIPAGENTVLPKIDKRLVVSAISIPCMVESPTEFFDGGATTLCPLGRAIDEGCDEIYIILGRSLKKKNEFSSRGLFGTRFLSFIFYGYRFLDLLMHEIILRDIAATQRVNIKLMAKEASDDQRKIVIHTIEPKFDLGSPLDFTLCNERISGSLSQSVRKTF